MAFSRMSATQAISERFALLFDGLRPDFRRRAIGIAAALFLELLLLLLLFTLGQNKEERREVPIAVVDLTARDVADDTPTPEPEPEPAAASPAQTQQPVQPEPVPPDNPAQPEAKPREQPAAPILPLPSRSNNSFDLSKVPKSPAPSARAAPAYGPQFSPRAGDSQRVGTAPNGQPMYAASWYREPTPDELAGYLSTATGPGWALITCKTVPDFRVEDCVGLGEYPNGSRIERAALAAAWQFRVRPPRLNGVYKVGEWVRIRIEYDYRAPPAGAGA